MEGVLAAAAAARVMVVGAMVEVIVTMWVICWVRARGRERRARRVEVLRLGILSVVDAGCDDSASIAVFLLELSSSVRRTLFQTLLWSWCRYSSKLQVVSELP